MQSHLSFENEVRREEIKDNKQGEVGHRHLRSFNMLKGLRISVS